MREPELLICLLKEMSEQNDGTLALPAYYGDQEAARRRHHADLLADAGHAEWTHESMVRITTQGYDLLQAVESQPEARASFLDLCRKGMEYVQAAMKAVEIASKLAAGG